MPYGPRGPVTGPGGGMSGPPGNWQRSGMPPSAGMFPGGPGMPPGLRPGMSGLSPAPSTPGGFGPLAGATRPGMAPGRLPSGLMGTTRQPGMSGAAPARPGTPGLSGIA